MLEFERGQVLLGRYTLKGHIDGGGMGDVYLARDQELGRDVAIKRIKIDADVPQQEIPNFLKRFRLEARAVAKLRHQNIVTIHDVQQVGDSPILVMEYFKGGAPLLKWGAGAKPSIPQWLSVAKQIFSALQHAHSRGILHRDIKAGNLLARGPADEAEILLIDWGIALNEEATRVTHVDNVVGTPGLIDPAVLKGGQWSRQSDFYALGGLLYTCLCGTKPHAIPKDASAIGRDKIYAENKIIPPFKANPAIDSDLQRFLLRLLESDPANRPSSARAAIAMIDALVRAEDIDFDAISAKYPAEPVTAEDNEDDEGPTEEQLPNTDATKKLGPRTDSVARDMLAEFQSKPKVAAGPSIPKQRDDRPGNEPDVVEVGTRDIVGLSERSAIAGLDKPRPSSSEQDGEFDDRIAEFRPAGMAPPKKSRTLVYVATIAVLVVAAALFFAKRQLADKQAVVEQQQAANISGTLLTPADLQKRDREPTAVETLAV